MSDPKVDLVELENLEVILSGKWGDKVTMNKIENTLAVLKKPIITKRYITAEDAADYLECMLTSETLIHVNQHKDLTNVEFK